METQYIKEKIEMLLNRFLLDKANVDIVDNDDINMTIFSIKTEQPQSMIGYNGETLSAFSHIIKKISDKKETEKQQSDNTARKIKTAFIVDINDYQNRKLTELKDKSFVLAERAKYFKSSIDMESMSPYDRMIIHSIFANNQDFSTESDGVGMDRHVVIKYIGG